MRHLARAYLLPKLREEIALIAKKHLRPISNAVLLDFGCGNLPYKSIFEPYADRYLAADLIGNKHADFYISPQDSLPIAKNSINTVISFQVLEHVESPSDYLSECYRIIKPTGLLIISTHGFWQHHPHPTDYWRWTSQGLQKIIKQTGFEIVDFRGVMGLSATGLQLFQDGMQYKVPRRFRSLFYRIMQTSIKFVDKRTSDAKHDQDASVYVVVARKN